MLESLGIQLSRLFCELEFWFSWKSYLILPLFTTFCEPLPFDKNSGQALSEASSRPRSYPRLNGRAGVCIPDERRGSVFLRTKITGNLWENQYKSPCIWTKKHRIHKQKKYVFRWTLLYLLCFCGYSIFMIGKKVDNLFTFKQQLYVCLNSFE